MMRRGGAHGINASQDRTDRAIDNRIRRDDGGGVDDVTHGSPPPALARRKQKGMKQTRNHIVARFIANLGLSATLWTIHQFGNLNTTSTKGAGQRLYSPLLVSLTEVA